MMYDTRWCYAIFILLDGGWRLAAYFLQNWPMWRISRSLRLSKLSCELVLCSMPARSYSLSVLVESLISNIKSCRSLSILFYPEFTAKLHMRTFAQTDESVSLQDSAGQLYDQPFLFSPMLLVHQLVYLLRLLMMRLFVKLQPYMHRGCYRVHFDF